ncbi:alkaline phosphatase D family protein [Paraglaciecola hydrolytica]|uniref:Twin-arginine translocation pathway signal n=1 Tax=Paraglaciecola hydrolytica TaxID=1799789 RepID=A0A136A2I7_9ALTE|nr:alkaline phosphatase D family protein [Paraglaciecola hydrolytica]KXI29446.1 twin-arginine translocation pathway signal [Paraglaciecola hydrolytica]
MKEQITRRDALKIAAAGLAASTLGCASVATPQKNVGVLKQKIVDSWSNTHDRVWIGGEYWANPMEDWHIVDGGAECLSTGGRRSIHSLTHQLTQAKNFSIAVGIKRLNLGASDGGAGLQLGLRSDINEYRSNCFEQKGYAAGIIKNQLILGTQNTDLSQMLGLDEVELSLQGEPRLGVMQLVLQAKLISTGQILAQLEDLVAFTKLEGNVSVISNFTDSSESQALENGTRYRFSLWALSGEAFNAKPEQKFGPILWTMYTLNDTLSEEGFVLKLSALTGPLGVNDNHELELQVQDAGIWQTLATATLDRDAWVATFRITNWDEKKAKSYRVVYAEKRRDGSVLTDVYSGLIKANPVGKKLRMAALTCQNDYAFPYAPVADNVVKLDPDLILFSGDQIYENHGGFGYIRAPVAPAILNYLRKYYQFGWAFRESMRNSPTVCLPDDHDVMQGNLWGEAGEPMAVDPVNPDRSDAAGGYIQPIRMLNTVHLTHTAHLPEPFDPMPTSTGLSSYYTTLLYGNVGFAILADRQWKSGPQQLNIKVGETGQGEDPHIINPAYDREDLQLLGKRQEAFLQTWGQDWRGHELKAVLSQTVFAGISTHQPLPDRYLKYDFDSSGWPATARNRAIDIMRASKALHICGDTHLGTLSQYGVHTQRDSNWAFCTPAIAAGWPRWWRPDDLNLAMKNRPSHGLSQTGEYLDSFGNKIYVYAVANPEVGKSDNRYIMAHEKGSGFGFITFDSAALTYNMQAFRFLVDVTENGASNQFPGWPVVIHKDENAGANILG